MRKKVVSLQQEMLKMALSCKKVALSIIYFLETGNIGVEDIKDES